MSDRRTFIQRAFGLGAGFLASTKLYAAGEHAHSSESATQHETHRGSGPPIPVITPDVPDLPFKEVGGVKEFHLIAEPVKLELIPGKVIEVWGYNGSSPGPTIQANRGDRVRIILENRLPEPTTMHWHGLEIPVAMDGMPYISQKPIVPGESFAYEFTLHQEGTFFYHSHGAMQEMAGMMGMFILHPSNAYTPRVDRDFGIFLQEWAVLPNSTVPNSAGMEFNWLTFNGKAGPATTPIVVRLGDRIRIRFANIGMDHHPIHIHGHTFYVTGTEGGRQPQATWGPANTVLVGVAQARDIEFVANNPGNWMIHCHLPHHMMNSMMDLLSERMFVTSPLSRAQAAQQMKLMSKNRGGMQMGAHADAPAVSAAANRTAGFPQDAFMDMAMDGMMDRPENYGLPKNWSAGMQGMMSLLRVLPPDEYDHIMDLKRRQKGQEQSAPAHQHGGTR